MCFLDLNSRLVNLETVDLGHILGWILWRPKIRLDGKQHVRERRPEKSTVDIVVPATWIIDIIALGAEQLHTLLCDTSETSVSVAGHPRFRVWGS